MVGGGHQSNEETTDSVNASAVEALATFKSSVPMNQKKKHQTQHDMEMLFMKAIKDVTSPLR